MRRAGFNPWSCHQILHTLVEWAAMPSSRGSSPCRDQSMFLASPALAAGFFTSSATWEAPTNSRHSQINFKNNLKKTFFNCGQTYRDRWRRQWHPTPVLLPGKSHGWRSPVGCGPCGREELDTTERLHFHFSLSHIGEGNGNPLVFLPGESQGRRVAHSQTRLKWLSSSSILLLTWTYMTLCLLD